jgi:hypothetical protein
MSMSPTTRCYLRRLTPRWISCVRTLLGVRLKPLRLRNLLALPQEPLHEPHSRERGQMTLVHVFLLLS